MGKEPLMKKKVIVAVAAGVIVLLGIAVAAVLFMGKRSVPWQQGELSDMAQQNGAAFAAYGITSIGTVEETFPISGQETYLEVEEIYVTSGESVKADTKLVKFTEESVKALREELKQTEKETSLAYRAGVIEFEQEKINLVYERDTAILAGEQAQEVYEETILGLDDGVTRAKEALDEAKEELADYQEKLNSDYFYTTYQEAKETYDSNLALLKERMDEWGVSWSQVVSGGGGTVQMGRDMGGNNQYASALASLYNVLEENLTDMEEAQEAYENATTNGSLELQTMQLSIPSLEKAYAQQKESYESQVLQAKLTKETTLATAEAAQKNYETALEKAQADFDQVTDAYEDAVENMEAFESRIADGYYYAGAEGQLLRFSIRNGQKVTDGSRIYTMTNPEEMTVTVSVDQDNIAAVSVGDEVMVMSEESGMYTGTVQSVNPISSSSSQSSVTYSVQVLMTGNYQSLGNSETVTVYFGMKGAQ